MPLLGFLRGTGSTLTSYVFDNSPAGEGNAPQKAYAAAFVLLLIVLALNGAGRARSRAVGAGQASVGDRSGSGRERMSSSESLRTRAECAHRMAQCRSISDRH